MFGSMEYLKNLKEVKGKEKEKEGEGEGENFETWKKWEELWNLNWKRFFLTTINAPLTTWSWVPVWSTRVTDIGMENNVHKKKKSGFAYSLTHSSTFSSAGYIVLVLVEALNSISSFVTKTIRVTMLAKLVKKVGKKILTD